jgi:hypothetical protein
MDEKSAPIKFPYERHPDTPDGVLTLTTGRAVLVWAEC